MSQQGPEPGVTKTKRKIRTTRTVVIGKPVDVEPTPESLIVSAQGKPYRLEQPVAIRPAVAGDRGYIFQSWLRDYQNSPTVRRMDPRIYNLEHARVIDRLWESSAVIVASDPEEEASILGWACGELWGPGLPETMERLVYGQPPPEGGYAVIHYLYVRNNFRQRRIGTRLLVDLVGEDAIAGKLPLFYSHLPAPQRVEGAGMKPSPALSMAKDPQFNPYLAFAR